MGILDSDKVYTPLMRRYPVIQISLKSSKQSSWQLSYGCLKIHHRRRISKAYGYSPGYTGGRGQAAVSADYQPEE